MVVSHSLVIFLAWEIENSTSLLEIPMKFVSVKEKSMPGAVIKQFGW